MIRSSGKDLLIRSLCLGEPQRLMKRKSVIQFLIEMRIVHAGIVRES